MWLGPARGQDDPYHGRPGLAEGETTPASIANCETLPTTLAGFKQPADRVDLWVSGPLTLVQGDGAVWYLAICSSPAVRVLCVAYSDNGMRPGDRVMLRGAMRREDERHVLLDPCLASRT